METPKVMLVEDDESLSTMYKVKFENAGFEVRVCDNGLNAVTEIIEFMPDILFLDIMMPSMDGIETLSTIRRLAPSLTTKIVMFSNLNSKTEVEQCMQMGADAYVTKADTTPKQALDIVEKMLGLPHTESECTLIPIADHERCFVVRAHCPGCQRAIKVTVDFSDGTD